MNTYNVRDVETWGTFVIVWPRRIHVLQCAGTKYQRRRLQIDHIDTRRCVRRKNRVTYSAEEVLMNGFRCQTKCHQQLYGRRLVERKRISSRILQCKEMTMVTSGSRSAINNTALDEEEDCGRRVKVTVQEQRPLDRSIGLIDADMPYLDLYWNTSEHDHWVEENAEDSGINYNERKKWTNDPNKNGNKSLRWRWPISNREGRRRRQLCIVWTLAHERNKWQ